MEGNDPKTSIIELNSDEYGVHTLQNCSTHSNTDVFVFESTLNWIFINLFSLPLHHETQYYVNSSILKNNITPNQTIVGNIPMRINNRPLYISEHDHHIRNFQYNVETVDIANGILRDRYHYDSMLNSQSEYSANRPEYDKPSNRSKRKRCDRQKRDHNDAERRRRKIINKAIEDLANKLPSCDNNRSKLSILNDVACYIDLLQEELKILREENSRQKNESQAK